MSIQNIFSKFTSKIHFFRIPHVYYFVPKCPVCGSWHTGRYVRFSFTDADYTDRKSMENGEIIKQVKSEPIKNCFCEDCGYEWGAHIDTRFMTVDEIMEQKKLRGIDKKFEEYKGEHYINGKPPKPSIINRWLL